MIKQPACINQPLCSVTENISFWIFATAFLNGTFLIWKLDKKNQAKKEVLSISHYTYGMPIFWSAGASNISDYNTIGWSLEHKDSENFPAELDQMSIS